MECSAYNFKQDVERKKTKSWLKSISAFANTSGGSLFFGNAKENGGLQTEVTEGLQTKFTEGLQSTADKIVELMVQKETITTEQMANLLGITRQAVAKHIKRLQEQGIIKRVGPDYGGHWKVCKP